MKTSIDRMVGMAPTSAKHFLTFSCLIWDSDGKCQLETKTTFLAGYIQESRHLILKKKLTSRHATQGTRKKAINQKTKY
jgi:hypothetical protein